MAKPAYFPFYPRDFASDGVVEAMSTLAVGAYVLLLCKAWFETPPGSLPEDDAVLSRWARLSEVDWSNVRNEVLAAFRKDGNRYVQKRMTHEHAQLVVRLNALSEAGKRGGRGRKKRGRSQAKARPKPGSSSAFDFDYGSDSSPSGESEGEKSKPRLALPASLDTAECRASIETWLKYKRERGEMYKPTGLKALLSKLEKWGPDKATAAILSSMSSMYAGLFEPRGASSNGKPDWRERKIAGEFKEDLEHQVPITYGVTGTAGQ